MEKIRNGTKLAHDVYADFPDTLMRRIAFWYFTKILDGEKAIYDHTYRELLYFKNNWI